MIVVSTNIDNSGSGSSSTGDIGGIGGIGGIEGGSGDSSGSGSGSWTNQSVVNDVTQRYKDVTSHHHVSAIMSQAQVRVCIGG